MVAIPSDRGIRSGKLKEMETEGEMFVAIPSDRGIRSGKFEVLRNSKGG